MIWTYQKAYKFPYFKPVAIFGCSCKSRLKVVNSFINSGPFDRIPLVAELTICKTRTVRYLWISYIHTNHSLLLNAPVISQHVFTSGHRILILCITHRLLLFITSSAVCVFAWSRDLATRREHIRFTKFQIGDNYWDLRSHLWTRDICVHSLECLHGHSSHVSCLLAMRINLISHWVFMIPQTVIHFSVLHSLFPWQIVTCRFSASPLCHPSFKQSCYQLCMLG